VYERILLALDAGRVASAAVPVVAELAGRSGAEVLVVHVRDIERELRTRYEAEQLVERTVGRLRALGVRARGEVRTIVRGDVSRAILQSAAWFDADMVVLGSHGRGELGGLLLGSVGQRVAAGTGAAVMLVHGEPGRPSRRWRRQLGRVLLAVDHGERAEAAVQAALALCRQHRAAVTVVHVHSIFESPGYARRYVASIADRFASAGVDARAESLAAALPGVPVQIADAAERANADVIVIGSRRRGELSAILLGSVARELVRLTTRPVLMADVPARVDEPAGGPPPVHQEVR
jgi:nucleotide-binding universal stress UspA family protein